MTVRDDLTHAGARFGSGGLERERQRRAVCLLALALVGGVASAQRAPRGTLGTGPVGNAEERRLAFVETRIGYDEAQKELARTRDLHEQGLVSEAELEREETSLELAEVAMRRAWMRLALADPEVVLRAARKYQEGGEARVEIELIARWSLGIGAEVSGGEPGGGLEMPALEGLSNVVISLKTTRGYSSEGVLLEPTIVSVPYEQRIPLMKFDEAVQVDFGLLLPDVQELVVEMRYNDRAHDRQVLLGKRADDDGRLVARAEQIALDAELGSDAVFELSLERFDHAAAGYDLRLEGLPSEITVRATDPASGAVFSQVFFPEGVTDRQVELRLTLPTRPTASVVPDRAVPFSVVFSAGRRGRGSAAGGVDLTVIPRGVAELEIEAVNLYHELTRGESLSFDIRATNPGSRVLEQVELSVNVPFGWRTSVTPALLPTLAPGEETPATIELTPPADVLVGDYEGSVRGRSLSGDRLVESEPKTLRLHVTAAGNPLLLLSLLLGVAGVLAGVIWGGVVLSRR